jgi:hypothetical protein
MFWLMNLIEKIADDFVQEVLKDHPIEIILIEIDVSDFIDDKNISADQLNEHLKQHLDSKKENIDMKKVIHEKLLSTSKYQSKVDEEYRDVIDYTQIIANNVETIPDPIIGEIVQLLLSDERVKIRIMYEIEDMEQDDLWSSDIWFYHRDSNLNDVINYIRDLNDILRQYDEMDDGKDLMA